MSEEPKKIKKSIIREDFLKLTDDLTAAVILNQLLYWTDRVKHFDKILLDIQRIQDIKIENIPLLQGWIYKSGKELAEETLLNCSKDTISRGVNRLIKQGLISRRVNPKMKWDRTPQYQVNLLFLHQELKRAGFNGLEGYKFSAKIAEINVGINLTQNAALAKQNAAPIQANRVSNNRDYNRDYNRDSFLRKEEGFSQGENSDDPKAKRRKLDTTEYLAKSRKQPSRTRTVKSLDRINAEYIIDTLWKEQDLVQHTPGTKTYKTLASVIEDMLKGKCAWFKGKKFHRQDFAKSIKQFALAANHPDYEVPITSSYKNKLKKMSFLTFIYNDFSANGNKSLFLHYLENDAKLLAEKSLKESNPALTNALIDEFYNNQLNLKKEDVNRGTFIRVSNKLVQLFEDNKSRVNYHLLPSNEKLAKWLVKLVFEGANGQFVLPHWLNNKLVFSEKLPAFLNSQNVFKGIKPKRDTPKYLPADPKYHKPQEDRYGD